MATTAAGGDAVAQFKDLSIDKERDQTAVSPECAKTKKKKAKKAYLPLPLSEARADDLPFRVAFSQRLGRHAIAKQHIPAGTLLWAEAPALVLLHDHAVASFCSACTHHIHGATPDQAEGSQEYKRVYCSAACRQASAELDEGLKLQAVLDAVPSLQAQWPGNPHMATTLRMVATLDALSNLEDRRGGGANGGAPAAAAEAGKANGGAVEAPEGAVAHSHSHSHAHAHSHSHGEGGEEGGCGCHGHAPRQPDPDVAAALTVRGSVADVLVMQGKLDAQQEPMRKQLPGACRALHRLISEAGGWAPSSPERLLALAVLLLDNAASFGPADAPPAADRSPAVGVGLLPLLSLLNHSCRPNVAVVTLANGLHVVRAIVEVAPGQELTRTYTGVYEARRARQRVLLQHHGFRCACARCSEPMAASSDRWLEGVLCGRAGCGDVLLPRSLHAAVGASVGDESAAEEWVCCGCGRIAPGQTPERNGCQDTTALALVALRGIMMVANSKQGQSPQSPVVGMVEEHVRRFHGKLPDSHMSMLDALQLQARGCRATGDAAKAIEACQRVTAALELLLPGQPSSMAAAFYHGAGEMYAEKAAQAQQRRLPPRVAVLATKAARECLNKALAMRQVMLGPHHPTVAAIQDLLVRTR